MSSTGTITSTGLSGIDVESLVTKLMNVEKAPITLLDKKESSYETKLTAWGQVKSALSTLEDAASALKTGGSLLSYTATAADSGVASATAKSTASAGTYSLEVSQLASSQKIKSQAYSSRSDAVSMGALTIATGSSSVDVTIDTSNNTLEGVMKAINNSDAGVTASIANDGSHYYLVVSSDKTGSSNSFSMSGISELSYDPSSTDSNSMSAVHSAQDAKFTVDGISYTRSSNAVSDAIDGLYLTLKGTNVGDATEITVAPDTADLSKKINTFIASYNAVINLAAKETAYDPSTGKAGDLNGDSSISRIKAQLRSIISGTFSTEGSLSRLSDIGIKTAVDGTLSISNETKFNSTLSSSSEDVAKLFGGQGTIGGISDGIYEKISDYLSSDGMVAKRVESLNSSISKIESKKDKFNDRMDIIEATYRAKFKAMESLISSMNSTSDYLTNTLKSMNSSES